MAMTDLFRRMRAGSMAAVLIGTSIAASSVSAQSVTDGAYPVADPDKMTLITPARAEAER